MLHHALVTIRRAGAIAAATVVIGLSARTSSPFALAPPRTPVPLIARPHAIPSPAACDERAPSYERVANNSNSNALTARPAVPAAAPQSPPAPGMPGRRGGAGGCDFHLNTTGASRCS